MTTAAPTVETLRPIVSAVRRIVTRGLTPASSKMSCERAQIFLTGAGSRLRMAASGSSRTSRT
ncbi:MAG: hypothetical protein IPN90_00640 [Elusimicrobia bacterium]|nr:hypothetical protein [Elusimicrobiota bacterium]